MERQKPSEEPKKEEEIVQNTPPFELETDAKTNPFIGEEPRNLILAGKMQDGEFD